MSESIRIVGQSSIPESILTWADGTVARIAGAILDAHPAGSRRPVGDAAMLADALTDAGCDNDWLVRQVRAMASHSQPWASYTTDDTGPDGERLVVPREVLCRLAGRPTPEEEAEAAKVAAAARLAEVQAAVTAEAVAELESEAAECYAARNVSGAYWARQLIAAMQRPGYVSARVVARDGTIRGTPPAGHVWILPSTGGRWGKSRREKKGRRLTLDEMEAILAAREEEVAK